MEVLKNVQSCVDRPLVIHIWLTSDKICFIATSIEAFVPDLKKNPRLAYRKFGIEFCFWRDPAHTYKSCIWWVLNRRFDRWMPTYLVTMRLPRTTVSIISCSLPLADWLALPDNSGTDLLTGNVINIAGYNIDSVIDVSDAAATSFGYRKIIRGIYLWPQDCVSRISSIT
jgi:hypothetical protein